MTQDYILARLLANNAQWAEDVEKAEPGFLADLAKQQTPKVSPASLRFVTEPLVPRYANTCISPALLFSSCRSGGQSCTTTSRFAVYLALGEAGGGVTSI